MNDYLSPELIQAQKTEKHALISNVTKLGILFILYDFIFTSLFKRVLVYGYYAIFSKSLNFNPKVMNAFFESKADVISSTAFKMFFSCFVILLSLISIIITARIIGIRVLSTVKINKQGVKIGLIAYPVGLVINSILTGFTSIITKLFSANGKTIPTADFSVDSPSAKAIILTIMYLVVVAPIAEEIVFRGIILKALSPFGKKNAIILSALLFALMHKNIPQAVGAFTIGILFAVIDIKANSIVPSIIMHTLNNILPCLMNINASVKSSAISMTYNILVNAVVLAGIAITAVKGRQLFSLKEETASEMSALPESQKRFAIFLNPAIVIYILILLYSLVSSIIIANK